MADITLGKDRPLVIYDEAKALAENPTANVFKTHFEMSPSLLRARSEEMESLWRRELARIAQLEQTNLWRTVRFDPALNLTTPTFAGRQSTPEERRRLDDAIVNRHLREAQELQERTEARMERLRRVLSGEVTAAMIEREGNSELRRIMLDRLGFERYVQEGNFRLVAKDQYGELLESGVLNDALSWDVHANEPYKAVRVLNSTPDWHPAANDKQENCGHKRLRVKHHDARCRHCGRAGHYRTYILRVPPNMRTPREAIAWTFGLEEEQYRPLQMT